MSDPEHRQLPASTQLALLGLVPCPDPSLCLTEATWNEMIQSEVFDLNVIRPAPEEATPWEKHLLLEQLGPTTSEQRTPTRVFCAVRTLTRDTKVAVTTLASAPYHLTFDQMHAAVEEDTCEHQSAALKLFLMCPFLFSFFDIPMRTWNRAQSPSPSLPALSLSSDQQREFDLFCVWFQSNILMCAPQDTTAVALSYLWDWFFPRAWIPRSAASLRDPVLLLDHALDTVGNLFAHPFYLHAFDTLDVSKVHTERRNQLRQLAMHFSPRLAALFPGELKMFDIALPIERLLAMHMRVPFPIRESTLDRIEDYIISNTPDMGVCAELIGRIRILANQHAHACAPSPPPAILSSPIHQPQQQQPVAAITVPPPPKKRKTSTQPRKPGKKPRKSAVQPPPPPAASLVTQSVPPPPELHRQESMFDDPDAPPRPPVVTGSQLASPMPPRLTDEFMCTPPTLLLAASAAASMSPLRSLSGRIM